MHRLQNTRPAPAAAFKHPLQRQKIDLYDRNRWVSRHPKFIPMPSRSSVGTSMRRTAPSCWRWTRRAHPGPELCTAFTATPEQTQPTKDKHNHTRHHNAAHHPQCREERPHYHSLATQSLRRTRGVQTSGRSGHPISKILVLPAHPNTNKPRYHPCPALLLNARPHFAPRHTSYVN